VERRGLLAGEEREDRDGMAPDEDGDTGREEDSWSMAPGGTDSTPAQVVEERWSSPPGVRGPSREMKTAPPGNPPRSEDVGSVVVRDISIQLREVREIVQQMAMAQLEQDTFDESRRRDEDARERDGQVLLELAGSMNRIEEMIVELARGMNDVLAKVETIRGEIQRDARDEVDRQLAEFLADIEPSNGRQDRSIPCEEDASGQVTSGGVRELSGGRETSAPPRRSTGRGRRRGR
jgi:hypothetical protein